LRDGAAGTERDRLPGPGRSFEGFQGDDAACRQWASQQAGTTPEAAAGRSTAESAGLGTRFWAIVNEPPPESARKGNSRVLLE
jgi:hypothetical protein